MGFRNGIITTVALALYALALGGIVSTDTFSHAAAKEARGYDALMREVLAGDTHAMSAPTMVADAPQAVRR